MVENVKMRVSPEFVRLIADVNITVLKTKGRSLTSAEATKIVADAFRDDVLQYEKIIRL